MMANLDLTPTTLHPRVLRVLEHMGMLEFIDERSFRFRSPIYRFVDLCMAYAEEPWEESATDANAHADSTRLDTMDEDMSDQAPSESIGDWMDDGPEETRV